MCICDVCHEDRDVVVARQGFFRRQGLKTGTHPIFSIFLLTGGPNHDEIAFTMPRIARVVISGYPYHIIQRGNNRQAIFFEDEDRRGYLDLLRNYSKKWACKILAYCLMGNHVHLLVEPNKEIGLSKFMQGVSLCYTQRVNRKYQRTGRLWECRYHSCLVEKDTYLLAVCRYIECNPVRANIVRAAAEYGWSSAKAHVLGKRDPLLGDSNWLVEIIDLQHYHSYLVEEESQNELRAIRCMTQQGRPLGTLKFQQEIEQALKRKLIPRLRGRPRKETGNRK
jgi:putative transposase